MIKNCNRIPKHKTFVKEKCKVEEETIYGLKAYHFEFYTKTRYYIIDSRGKPNEPILKYSVDLKFKLKKGF